MSKRIGGLTALLAGAALILSPTAAAGGGEEPMSDPVPVRRGSFDRVIPRPSSVTTTAGDFELVDGTVLTIVRDADARAAAELLRDALRPATTLRLPVRAGRADPGRSRVVFTTAGANADLGDEGYELRVAPERLEVVARTASGFGWAVQTIRQLLPPEIEAAEPVPGRWVVPGGTVRDVPRFAWRGVMLDVARHFFGPREVKRVVDLAARYKLNRFHLHLTDDQGWRLQIGKYPELTRVGARTALGGGRGGFYTQRQYRSIVEYAARRGVVVVPEIDVPGHTQAALASLAWLNCGGVAPAVNTSNSTLKSSLCVERERTQTFVDDVFAEVAALTPGGYVHIGGDEATGTAPDAFRQFVERTLASVRDLGKEPLVWEEAAVAPIGRDAIVQFWLDPAHALEAVQQGAHVLLSPASRAYLDMKYDESTPVGTNWAGYVDTRTAYSWEPATHVAGVPEDHIAGIEAPLWTETVTTIAEVEQMLLPRLPAYAELGWSAGDTRDWDDFRTRLAPHRARWDAAGYTWTRDASVESDDGDGLPG